MSIKYPCPCCGYLTFESSVEETELVCPICGWQDLKKAGVERQEAGGGNLEEDSALFQLLFAFKGEACTNLGGRDEGYSLLPSATCPLPNEAEASVKYIWDKSGLNRGLSLREAQRNFLVNTQYIH